MGGGYGNKVLYKVLPLYQFNLNLRVISIIAKYIRFKRLLTSNFKMEESGFF